MSTRSGKRIHSSFHENTLQPVEALDYKTEKKIRSKRSKENLELTLLKLKKRENYVSFPIDDESVGDSAVINEPELRGTRSLRKNALKVQNTTLPDIQATLESTKDPKKPARITRRTKKFSENEDHSDTKNNEVTTLEAVEKLKPKKNKEKIASFVETTEEAAPVQVRKSKRKKKKSTLNSLIVEKIHQNAVKDNSVNQSNMSIDSFNGAAGSPQRVNANEAIKEKLSNNTSDLESKLNTERKNIKTNKSEKQNKKKPVKNATIETEKATLDPDNTPKYETKLNKLDVKDSSFNKNDMDAISGCSNKNQSSVKVQETSLDTDTFPQRRQSKKYSVKDNDLSLSSNKDITTTFEKGTDFAIDKSDNSCSVQNGQLRMRRSYIKKSSLAFTLTEEINDDSSGLSINNSSKNNKKGAVIEQAGVNKRKSIQDTNLTFTPSIESINSIHEKDTEVESTKTRKRKSSMKDTSFTFTPTITERINPTFEKDTKVESRKRKFSMKDTNLTFTPIITGTINTTFQNGNEVESRRRKPSIKDNNLTLTPTITESINNATFEKDNEVESRRRKPSIKDNNLTLTPTISESINNATFEKDNEVECRKSTPSIKDTNLTFTPTITESINNATFEKDNEVESMGTRKRKYSTTDTNVTFTPTITKRINNTFEKDNEMESNSMINRKSSVKDTNLTFSPTVTKEINTTFDKSDNSVCINKTFDKRNTNEVDDKRKSVINSDNFNGTYEKSPAMDKTAEKSDENNTFNKSKELNDTTFDKDKNLDLTFDKTNSKSSIITSDSSNNGTISNNISHVSITSDDTCENIMNTTPLLIESSLEESRLVDDTMKAESPQTPLKREGTFTKESPAVENITNKTPTKRMSLPSPGCTPYLSRNSNREKTILNVTRSIERGRRSSLDDVPLRQTKVMFCSPVNNPGVVTQQKRKVIKSNLKGSNKSFVLDETVSRPAARKRSYTLSDADEARVKRKRLADGIQHSVDRLSRPRTTSASAKLEPSTPSKKQPPSKSKSDAKVSRVKLPNFAVLHQREFDKMESLDECQERRAKRAKQLLTPTGTLTTLDRSSKGPSPDQQSQTEAKNQGTPTKRFQTQLPAPDTIKPGYTRFGFKLNMDANPFSVPPKNQQIKPKESKPNVLTREATFPSLVGGTSLRREAAKHVVLREKSFTGKRNDKRIENRTVIKGVRTNRRFELQMRMRNMEQ